MCGIAGIFRFDGKPVQREAIELMNQSMLDRGPDAGGIYLDRDLGMGARRLSIIDVENGNQPLTNRDGRLSIVMNGEIYNHLELRKDLQAKGYVFNTRSDTEVLLHMYDEYGKKCLQYLIGMFAFAIWNKTERTLWLARDRFGIKPIVFYQDKNMFCFASTQTALLKLPDIKKSLNSDSLLLYFLLSYIPAPKTIWKGIQKLLPGRSLTVDNRSIEIEQYWDLTSGRQKNVYDQEVDHQIREMFHRSVELNSRSDVPVGVFLSGGLDSTAITSSYCRQKNNEVHTFTVDCEGKHLMEGDFAKIAANQYQTNHHHYKLSGDQSFLELDELLEKFDEPIGDSASISSYYLSKRAAENGIKVVLCGAGSDELFGGYSRHYRNRRNFFSGKASLIPWHLLQWLGKSNSEILHYASIGWDRGTSFGLSTSGAHIGLLNKLLDDKEILFQGLQLVKAQFGMLIHLEKTEGFQYSRLLTDISNYLPDNVLALFDKTTMAASVEGRVPFLDHTLAELVFSEPPEKMLSNNFVDSKCKLKSALSREVPTQIRNRSKVGFDGPVNYWINSNCSFRDRLLDLANPDLKSLISHQQIKNLLNHETLHPGLPHALFKLYVMDSWLEKHA